MICSDFYLDPTGHDLSLLCYFPENFVYDLCDQGQSHFSTM